MCKFCENLEYQEFEWLKRSTYADDNLCEIVNGEDCSLCADCDSEFNLTTSKYNGNTYVSIAYNQSVAFVEGIVVVHPFSEQIQFNYCPFCGKKISENIKELEDVEYGYFILKQSDKT